MAITIAPFTVDLSWDYQAPPVGCEKEERTKRKHLPIAYWGIYIDDKYISYASIKELAEKTKLWMGKWVKDRI